jgi:hypothetical protein
MTVNELCLAVRERLETENTGYIPGVERPLLKISNRYQGLWLEHLYDAILYAKMDGSKLYLAENAVYEFIAHQRKSGQLPMAMTATGVGYTHIQECVSFGKLVLMIYEMNGDRDFLATAYDALVKWVAWLRSARMTMGKGLVEQFVAMIRVMTTAFATWEWGAKVVTRKRRSYPTMPTYCRLMTA